MRAFRLSRLLRLREEESELAKQNWRLAERSARSAADVATHARELLRSARFDLGRTFEAAGDNLAAAGVLTAHEAIDALVARVLAADDRARAARAQADEKRALHEEQERRVSALRTLEDRHKREERRRLRRREERALDEALVSRRRTSGPSSAESSERRGEKR